MTTVPNLADSVDLLPVAPGVLLVLAGLLVGLITVPMLAALLRLAGLVLRAVIQLVCIIAVLVLCLVVVAGWSCHGFETGHGAPVVRADTAPAPVLPAPPR